MVNITIAGGLIAFLLGIKQSSFALNEYSGPAFQSSTSIIGVDGFIYKLAKNQSRSYCFRNINLHSLLLDYLLLPDST